MRAVASDVSKVPSTARERLKEAAKRLFTIHGFDGVSVRDILREAGERNGASISLHFGSKDELVREIIADIFCARDAYWKEDLEHLESEGRALSIRDYVKLIISSHERFARDGESYSSRLSLNLTHQRYNAIADVMRQYRLVSYDRILSRIAERLPDLPDHIRRQRLIALTRYVMSMVALYEEKRTGAGGGTAIDLGDIIDTTCGLLTAPINEGDD